MTTITITLTDREYHTVLAALRQWQEMGTPGFDRIGQDMWTIASNGGEVKPLDAEEVDQLVYRINVG